MSAPQPNPYFSGVGAVSADGFNTFPQVAYNLAQLRSFTGVTNQVAFVLGAVAPIDGYQSFYLYMSSGSYVDNGGSVIVPNGALSGAWLRVPLGGLTFSTTQPPAGSGLVFNNNGFLCVA